MRPTEVLRRASGYLDRHGVESPDATAEILLLHVLGTDRAGLYARSRGPGHARGPDVRARDLPAVRRHAGAAPDR